MGHVRDFVRPVQLGCVVELKSTALTTASAARDRISALHIDGFSRRVGRLSSVRDTFVDSFERELCVDVGHG
jgi:hypothetical protein